MSAVKHNFSPIINDSRLTEAMEYIAAASLALSRKVLNKELSIDTICFFTHSQEEYEYLLAAIHKRGTESELSHEPTTYVETDCIVADQHIAILGVRKPDSTRPWVGYGDYPLTDAQYASLLSEGNPNIDEITSGRGQSLLQFKHSDFDVLGYAFRQDEHKQ